MAETKRYLSHVTKEERELIDQMRRVSPEIRSMMVMAAHAIAQTQPLKKKAQPDGPRLRLVEGGISAANP